MSTIGAYFRLARAGWIMVREGVIAAAPGEHLEGLPRLGWQVARLLARRRVRERCSKQRWRPSRVGLTGMRGCARCSKRPRIMKRCATG